MSIIIPGMKMPEKCSTCPFVEDDFLEDYFSPYCPLTGERLYGNERLNRCPVIELPQHGRLIDADRLLEDYGLGVDCAKCKRDERSCQYEMIHSTMDFCGWIDDAKTIIPADPEGGAGNG